MYYSWLFFIVVISSINFVESYDLQTLNGEWSIDEAQGKYTKLEARVPGGIYTDLMKNGVIGDVLYEFNDENYRWVGKTNWNYYRTFTVSEDFFLHENINLVLNGVDTFAEIIINEKPINTTKNMFIRYIFDVKKHLQAGTNSIRVQFENAVSKGARLAQEEGYDIPPACPADAYRGECHVNMIRKMQASFAWDWGPAVPSVGIWKDIYLEAYNLSLIRVVSVDIEEQKSKDTWQIKITTELAPTSLRNPISGHLSCTLQTNLRNITEEKQVEVTANKYGELNIETLIEIPKNYVETWWPNGYGAQPLYNLIVVFKDTNSSNVEEDTVIKKIGFRTVELKQDTLDTGLNFYFVVNDVPIFMKGSNEIPIDILPERSQDTTTIRTLMETARDSHMNMIRVWGGGVYESDYFYATADEFGILIWQDFMFACALYPVNDEFLNNTIEEVRQQIKRLKTHPSVALFSGNNENEGVIADNWYSISNMTRYKEDYVKLYIDTIRTEFDRLTNGKAIFISSSPTNGKESEKENYIAKNPGSTLYGDIHYYNYALDGMNPNIYRIPRFASEYGYQSFPSIDTWLTVTSNTSYLEITSELMQSRQHHPLGNIEIPVLIAYQLGLPDVSSPNYFKAVVFYSQVLQAMSVKIQTEHYRRYRSSENNIGEGFTMGALYWQLNDVWVAPTWSGIDYTGKWKMLQYFVKDFFAPVIVTGQIDAAGELSIYVVSDLLIRIENATVVMNIYNWNSTTPITSTVTPINIEPNRATLIDKLNVDFTLSKAGCGVLAVAKYNCFIYLNLTKSGVNIAPENFVLPSTIKTTTIETPKIEIGNITTLDEGSNFEITLTTDNIALFVWLDTKDLKGRFTENGFIMVNNIRNVFFHAERNTTVEELRNMLTVTNVMDDEYKRQ